MSTRSHLKRKLFHVLITIVVTATSLPLTSSGVVAQTESPAQASRIPPGLRLYAVVDPPVVEPGAQAVCTITVYNDDEDATGLKLSANLPGGLSVAGGKGSGRRWNSAIDSLALGETASIELPLQVSGDASGPLSFEIRVSGGLGGARATTTAIVGVAGAEEARRVAAAGGVFDGGDGRVRVHFPAGALRAEVRVSARMHQQQPDPRGRAKRAADDEAPSRNGTLLRFSLEAQDATTGEDVHEFGRPVILSVDLRGLIDASGLLAGQHVYLAYLIDPETGEMEDVEAAYDKETGLLAAEIDHFSEWEIGMVGEGWKPILTPPVPDLFSGAVTYDYPVQVPAGRNGLQPSVALSYNSRRIDTLIDLDDDDGGPVALGWSLGASDVEIVRRHKHKSDGAHMRLHLYNRLVAQ